MNALVVYESLWGNTAQVARAIAEGFGPAARALPVDEATAELVAHVDLIVAGAPLLGFNLPTEQMRTAIAADPAHAGHAPDLSHPAMRTWLEHLPDGTAAFAAFETRIWWSPGSSAKRIAAAMRGLGYRQLSTPGRFLVTGKYGPLKEGELERARAWGATLARTVADTEG